MKTLLPCLLALFAVGCAKRIPVSYDEPAVVFVDASTPVSVQVEVSDHGHETLDAVRTGMSGLFLNRQAAVPVLERELVSAIQHSGYRVSGGADALVVVKVEPVRWSMYVEARPASIGRPNQHVVLDVEAKFVDAKASQAREYRCEAPLWPFDEAGGMNEAARVCAAKVLADFTPKRVSRQLPLDKSDPLSTPGLQACESGRFDEALQKFTEASAAAPQSASLVYNRGVLSLWKGQVEDADVLLARAVQMKPGERDYAEAKAFSERAVKARQGQGVVKP